MTIQPEILIAIKPAPICDVMTDEFKIESDRLVRLHEAAPDLLEALKQASFVLEGLAMLGGHTSVIPYLNRAKKAIAKAEGGAS